MYQYLENGNFEEEYESNKEYFEDIRKLGLQKVVARPTILLYYDMLCCIRTHIDVRTYIIVN